MDTTNSMQRFAKSLIFVFIFLGCTQISFGQNDSNSVSVAQNEKSVILYQTDLNKDIRFYIQFGRYVNYDNALKRIQSLNKLVQKPLLLEQGPEGFKIIAIEFKHIGEAREFLQETRAKGIDCFLLRN